MQKLLFIIQLWLQVLPNYQVLSTGNNRKHDEIRSYNVVDHNARSNTYNKTALSCMWSCRICICHRLYGDDIGK